MAVTTLVFALLACSLAQTYMVITAYSDAACSDLVTIVANIVDDGVPCTPQATCTPNGNFGSGKIECLEDPYTYAISGDATSQSTWNSSDCSGTLKQLTSTKLHTCIPVSSSMSMIADSCISLTRYSTADCTGDPVPSTPIPDIPFDSVNNVCFGDAGTSYQLSCGALCFHEDTLISYEGQQFTLAQLQTAEAPVCAIPHVVKANGVKISTTCPGSLRLTHDHLVYTHQGLRTAGSIKVGDFLFSDMEEQTVCEVTKVEVEVAQTYFGLNCEESIVLADGYKTSTFGLFHELPAMWMKYASKVLGVHTASALGDAFATVLHKINLI